MKKWSFETIIKAFKKELKKDNLSTFQLYVQSNLTNGEDWSKYSQESKTFY